MHSRADVYDGEVRIRFIAFAVTSCILLEHLIILLHTSSKRSEPQLSPFACAAYLHCY